MTYRNLSGLKDAIKDLETYHDNEDIREEYEGPSLSEILSQFEAELECLDHDFSMLDRFKEARRDHNKQSDMEFEEYLDEFLIYDNEAVKEFEENQRKQ